MMLGSKVEGTQFNRSLGTLFLARAGKAGIVISGVCLKSEIGMAW